MLDQLLQNNFLLAGILFVISYIGGSWLNKRADAKKEAAEVAKKLRKFGLDEIPKLLEAYAMGDIPKMISQIKQLHMIAANDELLKKELDEIADRVIDEHVRTPVLRAILKKKINLAETDE